MIKKRNKKYKPKRVSPNPMLEVMQGMTLASESLSDLITTQRLKTSESMRKLLSGESTKYSINELVEVCNLTEVLRQSGFGKGDYDHVCIDARESILSIVERAHRINKFVGNGDEIKALNTMIELHDAQLDIIKAKEFGEAIFRARQLVKSDACRIKLRTPEFCKGE